MLSECHRRVLSRSAQQAGNILFLILLAIVLFAALASAVTSALRGGSKDATVESSNTGAGAIMQFLTQVNSALLRMQLVNGLRPENISFEYNVTAVNGGQFTGYANANCTSDTCRIFKPAGGNIVPATFQKYANPDSWTNPTWPTPGHFDFYMMRWPGAGTDSYDVVMRIIGLNPTTCNSVNALIGQTTGPTVDYSSSVTGFTPNSWDSGGFICTANCNILLDRSTYTAGSTVNGGTNQCIVYHLLITR